MALFVPTPPPPRRRPSPARTVALLLAFCVLTPAAVIGADSLVRDRIRARRAQIPDTLDLIRASEESYFADHGRYLPCGGPARARTVVDTSPSTPLPLEPDDGDCWGELGLDEQHVGAVLGGYWVEVPENGASFIARGICDVDADGAVAGFEATPSSPPVRITEGRIY
jgi:hypothetical protein